MYRRGWPPGLLWASGSVVALTNSTTRHLSFSALRSWLKIGEFETTDTGGGVWSWSATVTRHSVFLDESDNFVTGEGEEKNLGRLTSGHLGEREPYLSLLPFPCEG